MASFSKNKMTSERSAFAAMLDAQFAAGSRANKFDGLADPAADQPVDDEPPAEEEKAPAETFEVGSRVSGLVKAEIKGGYEVTVGKTRAFCPYSQMSLSRTEAAEFVGKTFAFSVTEFNADDANLVVGRRDILIEERNAKRRAAFDAVTAAHPVGSVVAAKITRVEVFGAFVALGDGVEGLIPAGALARAKRATKDKHAFDVGSEVDVSIERIDSELMRISLRPIDHEAEAREAERIADAAEVVEAMEKFRKANDSKSISTIGSMLDGLKLDL